MVDPVFKAPPPPPLNEQAPETPAQTAAVSSDPAPAQQASEPAPEQKQEEAVASKKQQLLNRLSEIKEHMIHYFTYSMLGLFLLGAFFGCTMSGSSPAPQKQTVSKGISARVVPNVDKKDKKFPICGADLPSKACLFYVLNSDSQEHTAEDYFEEAAKKMQRSSYKLGVDNVMYKRTLIKPGFFAEIIIPAR